jgi:hypothetical protein
MNYENQTEVNERVSLATRAHHDEEPTLCPCGNVASDYEGQCRDCANERLDWLAHSNATSPDAFAADASTALTHGINPSEREHRRHFQNKSKCNHETVTETEGMYERKIEN